MDIRQLLRDLRQNFLAVFLAFALCAAAGGAAAYVPAKRYQASTNLFLKPANPANAQSDVAVIQYVLLGLPTQAMAAGTLNAARDRVPFADQNADVTVTAAAPPTTDVLSISVSATNPRVAAAFTNAVADEVIALQGSNGIYDTEQPDPAQVPVTPSNPTLPILFAAIGFGLIAAVFAGLASAGVRRRFSRVTELKERIGATVLGEIPRVISGNIRPSSLFALGRQPMVMEAFQELRSNLLLSIPDGGPTSIAVTSCDPSEGKTSVVANMAWVLAAEGRHITAVDSDLRKPMLHLELEVPFGPGLASGGAADALRHASKTTNPYLDVVPAGIPSQHPSDVVSAYLPPLLHSLRERGQTVIVDCPPMIGVAETVLIAAMVDMVVVVVDTRRLHPDRLQQCLLRLDGAGANVIGVVLNRTRRRRRAGSYHYGYYGKEDSQLVPPAPTPVPAPGEATPSAVARSRWLSAPPTAERSSGQPPSRQSGRRGGATRPPVFRSPSTANPDEPAGGEANGAPENQPRRRQPEW
jgi:succinoglycan biosynthesis transport protein ExoP